MPLISYDRLCLLGLFYVASWCWNIIQWYSSNDSNTQVAWSSPGVSTWQKLIFVEWMDKQEQGPSSRVVADEAFNHGGASPVDSSFSLCDAGADGNHGEYKDSKTGTSRPFTDTEFANLTFNEKIWLRTRVDRRWIWPAMVDKGGVKAFAKMHNVDVPKTLFLRHVETNLMPPLLDRHDGIANKMSNFLGSERQQAVSKVCSSLPKVADLPDNFAMKATHTSGCSLLVLGGVIVGHKQCPDLSYQKSWPFMKKHIEKWVLRKNYNEIKDIQMHLESNLTTRTVSDKTLKESCMNWLSQQYLFQHIEWAYSEVTPGIIFEEVLFSGGVIPFSDPTRNLNLLANDFKCFTFHGRTEYISVVRGRFAEKTDTFFERSEDSNSTTASTWTRLDQVRFDSTKPESSAAPLPIQALNLVSAACDRLSSGFDFARVDTYVQHTEENQDGLRVLLGEITPYPGGGTHQWHGTPNLNEKMGKFWRCT